VAISEGLKSHDRILMDDWVRCATSQRGAVSCSDAGCLRWARAAPRNSWVAGDSRAIKATKIFYEEQFLQMVIYEAEPVG
jgi:hypothetical protein